MFLNTGIVGGSAAGAAVQLPAVDTRNTSSSSPVYAGLRFDSDGNIYRMSAAGLWQQVDAWLLEGSASTYYLFRTIDSGTLNNDDGDGNQLDTDDLDFWISNTTEWFGRSTTVTFNIADDTLGANVIATRSYTFYAFLTGSGEPP